MSRFLKTAIVLLAIAAMAAPAFAADNLSLSGQMRVRGWFVDNGTTTSKATGVKDDSTNTWADQRLRIGGKFTIADGVSITFRTDVTESNWGSGNTYGSGRIGVQQWDRAHLDLAFDAFSLRAGQQYVAFGNNYAFDAQSNGLTIKTKGPVAVTAFFMLADSNITDAEPAGYKFSATGTPEATAVADASNDSDGFYYGVNVGFGADNFKGNAFVAASKGVTGTKVDPATYKEIATGSVDQEIYLIGADTTINLDAVKIVAELDFFTGDSNATTDAFGTQLFVDGSFAASEALTVGGQLYYALGDKDDDQYTYLGNNFGNWDPLFEHGTGLNNEQIGMARPFAFFGKDSGVIAGRIYADAKVGDALKVGGSFAYLEPEEDANVTADSAITLAAGMKYAVMANTSIGALVEYIDIDDVDTDAYVRAGLGLFVNF